MRQTKALKRLPEVAKECLKNLEFNMGKKALALTIVFLLFSCAKKPVYTEAPFYKGGVRIELRTIRENKPVFYTFYHNKKGINYFVVKLPEGVQSYFDACVKCNPKKTGYRPEGDRLSCRACDIRYPLNNLKDGIGSCYPIKLPGRVEEGSYIIEVNDLMAGDKYF